MNHYLPDIEGLLLPMRQPEGCVVTLHNVVNGSSADGRFSSTVVIVAKLQVQQGMRRVFHLC
jgi:hypothetical protein